MIGSTINRPTVIIRGKFTVPPGDGEIGPPGSGSTITLYDQTKDWPLVNVALPGVQLAACPFARLRLTLFASADSGAAGVIFEESADDGTSFDVTDTSTYTAANLTMTFDYRCRGGHPRVRYTNSAAVLTTWRFTLEGLYDQAISGFSATKYINLPPSP